MCLNQCSTSTEGHKKSACLRIFIFELSAFFELWLLWSGLSNAWEAGIPFLENPLSWSL